MRLIDADALKEKVALMWGDNNHITESIYEIIDNAPTVIIDWEKSDAYLDCIKRIKSLEKENDELRQFLRANFERPQGECKGCEYLKDCETCEDKAKQYSLGFQDGYLTGGFQLAELRRWLIAQGYSEGTVDDKINEFTRFVEKMRGKEE